MGGFFGITSKCDCMMDVFFGVDYHSHLGTRRGGMAAYDEKIGLQRKIHNIENSPFRTKFEHIFNVVNLTLEAAFAVVERHAAAPGSQMGMIVSAKKDLQDHIFLGNRSKKTAHGSSL